MNWPQIRKQLKGQQPEQLIDLLKGLYDLTPANKAFIRSKFADSPQDSPFLEKSCKQVINAIYPPRWAYPDMPKFVQARKTINAYKKATGDIQGTIDLLLLIQSTVQPSPMILAI